MNIAEWRLGIYHVHVRCAVVNSSIDVFCRLFKQLHVQTLLVVVMQSQANYDMSIQSCSLIYLSA